MTPYKISLRFADHHKSIRRAAIVLLFLVGIKGVSHAQMRQLYLDPGVFHYILKMSFVSDSSGYVVFQNNSELNYTGDSGRTFSLKPIPNTAINYNGYTGSFGAFDPSGVKAFTKDSLFIYGNFFNGPAILFSSDGAQTFKVTFFNTDTTDVKDMVFPQNSNNGYAITKDRVLKTTDRGQTWTTQVLGYTNAFNYLEAVDDNNVFAFSVGTTTSKLLKTTNGTNWSPVTLPTGRLRYASFISPSKGWLSIQNSTDLDIYYTSNSGISWTLMNNPAVTGFIAYKLYFFNDSTGIGLSNNFKVYKTTDSGKVWEPYPRDLNYTYNGYVHNDLQVRNNNQFWAGGGHGLLEINTNASAPPLPKAYFAIDLANLASTNTVNLVNYSKPTYQYQWYKNNILFSTSYNASYIHQLSNPSDTIKLIVNNGTSTDSLTRIQNFTVTPPVITSFTPTTGPAGTAITISGNYFTGATSVTIGNVPVASFTVVSPFQINAVVGAGATGLITVTTPYGPGSSTGNTFTFISPPTATAFTPAFGADGTQVTITGTGFSSATKVTFGGVSRPFTIVSPTTITSGIFNCASGYVSVTNPAGKDSLAGFVYYPTPSVIGITPTIGAAGTPVEITGNNFTAASSVTIGGVAVSSFTVNSSTSITAVAGNGSTGNVIVTNPAISSTPGVPPVTFTFTSSPVITGFTPLSGPAGTQVTITGGNFNSNPTNNIVMFGTIKAIVLSASANTMVVQVPQGAAYQPISVTDVISKLTGYSQQSFTVTFPVYPSAFDANSFGPRNDLPTGLSPSDVVIGDIDNDGKADIITVNNTGGSITVYRNTSLPDTLRFAARIDIPMLAYIKRILLTDLDGDGKQDLVFSAGYTATGGGSPQTGLSIARNLSTPGNILFDTIKNISSPVYHHYIGVGDFDNDGKPDLAAVCENCILDNSTGGAVKIYRNTSSNGSISFTVPYTFNISSSFGGTVSYTYSQMRIADLNHDRKPDIILGVNASSFFVVFENKSPYSSINFSSRIIGNLTGGSGRSNPVVADFDNDGWSDIVTKEEIDRNLGTFLFSGQSNNNLVVTPGACADLNGDGKADYVGGDYNGSWLTDVVKNSTNSGSISFSSKYAFPSGSANFLNTFTPVTTCGDLDGDGKPEIIFTDASLNVVSILKNTIGTTRICPGSNTSFISNINGSTYQWQVNNGTGYSNLSNNANYSGVNTTTLQILSTPSAWYGYKYRCLVNGAQLSNEYLLQFTNTWTGAISTAWEDPGNWSCGSVPDAFTDVIINSGTIVINANTTIGSLVIRPGVSLTVGPGVIFTILH